MKVNLWLHLTKSKKPIPKILKKSLLILYVTSFNRNANFLSKCNRSRCTHCSSIIVSNISNTYVVIFQTYYWAGLHSVFFSHIKVLYYNISCKCLYHMSRSIFYGCGILYCYIHLAVFQLKVSGVFFDKDFFPR
jgi:hypothetical protein